MELEDNSPRLIVVSSSIKSWKVISQIVKSNVYFVIYQYSEISLNDVLGLIAEKLNGNKVESAAFIVPGNDKEIQLLPSKSLTKRSVLMDKDIKSFFHSLVNKHFLVTKDRRIDFLSSEMANSRDCNIVIQELELVLKIHIDMCSDLYGSSKDIMIKNQKTNISSLYFNIGKLDDLSQGSVNGFTNMSGYEKIRIVGKGAFGTAVLYRKKNDDSFVILKQINMHDLNASERQLAINEIKVLSMLNHKNIVSYINSFEVDGILMIEMEYADGGTLAQYLAQRRNPLDEKEILLFFQQICSAIQHMHEHNILHRDLKTANIFLTKEGAVKVGDFGISKMLTTRQGGAETVLGTPYYISPEMCEGKVYNNKSDIWALGCILYEMACLQKTFEGTNLPALVNKIMKGQFAPIRGNYTPHFKKLVRDLLQKEPEFRPTSNDLMLSRLPELMSRFDETNSEVEDDLITSSGLPRLKSSLIHSASPNEPRSVLYHMKLLESDISLTPVPLPQRTKLIEISSSSTHVIALTSEQQVYTWGNGSSGQLGHECLESWREKPLCVEALKGKSITKIAAGNSFSVFASDNGIVMTCGNGSNGCLGHGDWNSTSRPKLIEKLLSMDISGVHCGPKHVVVVSGDGDVYSWGCGADGRLGLGDEEDRCAPEKVVISDSRKVCKVRCGINGSMMITTSGAVFACGNNAYNKLGLNDQKGLVMQMKKLVVKPFIQKQCLPTRLLGINSRVVDVSLGPKHTVFLIETGNLIMLGDNSHAQFGLGSTKSYESPQYLKTMNDKTICMVQCGETYTIAGTIENAIYFWGTCYYGEHSVSQYFMVNSNNNQKKDDFDSLYQQQNQENDDPFKICSNKSSLMQELIESGPDASIMTVTSPKHKRNKLSLSASDLEKSKRKKSNNKAKTTISVPQEILALYASSTQVARGEIVNLSKIQCHRRNMYLVVDTTAPLPHSKNPKNNDRNTKTQVTSPTVIPEEKNSALKMDVSVSNEIDGNRFPSSNQDANSMGTIPVWLKNDIEEGNDFVASPFVEKKAPKHRTNKAKQKFYDDVTLPGSAGSDSTDSPLSPELELQLELDRVSKEKEAVEKKMKELERQLKQKENHEHRNQKDDENFLNFKGNSQPSPSKVCDIQ